MRTPLLAHCIRRPFGPLPPLSWPHVVRAVDQERRCHSALLPGAAPLSRPARTRTALTDYPALLGQRVLIATGCVSLRLFFASPLAHPRSTADSCLVREWGTSSRPEEGDFWFEPQPPGDFELCHIWARDKCRSCSSNVQSSVAREKTSNHESFSFHRRRDAAGVLPAPFLSAFLLCCRHAHRYLPIPPRARSKRVTDS